MRFAHLKTHHGFERLRLRGLSGARDEFHLAAIVQMLKTLALAPHPATARARLRELRRVGRWRGQADVSITETEKTRSAHNLPHQTRSQANGMSADGTLDDPSAKMKRA